MLANIRPATLDESYIDIAVIIMASSLILILFLFFFAPSRLFKRRFWNLRSFQKNTQKNRVPKWKRMLHLLTTSQLEDLVLACRTSRSEQQASLQLLLTESELTRYDSVGLSPSRRTDSPVRLIPSPGQRAAESSRDWCLIRRTDAMP